MKTQALGGFLLAIFLLTGCLIARADDYDLLIRKVYRNDLEGLKELVVSGVDVDASLPGSNATALFVACSLGDRVEIVEFLLESGAEVNIQGFRDGRTPLMWAAGNCLKSVELLIEHGADVKIKGVDGMTAFIQSIFGVLSKRISTDISSYLLAHGADINTQLTGPDAEGMTALMFAVRWDDVQLVKYLLKNGADVNLKTPWGETALTMARGKGNHGIEAVLLQHGALL